MGSDRGIGLSLPSQRSRNPHRSVHGPRPATGPCPRRRGDQLDVPVRFGADPRDDRRDAGRDRGGRAGRAGLAVRPPEPGGARRTPVRKRFAVATAFRRRRVRGPRQRTRNG